LRLQHVHQRRLAAAASHRRFDTDIIRTAAGLGHVQQQRIVPFRLFDFQFFGQHTDFADQQFVQFPLGRAEFDTIIAFLHGRELAGERPFARASLNGLQRQFHPAFIRLGQRGGLLRGGQRLALGVGQHGLHGHRIAQQAAVLVDQQHAVPRVLQQPPLGGPADELGVVPFKIGFVYRAQPPHFTTGLEEHSSGSVEMRRQIDRQLTVNRRVGVGKPSVDAGRRLGVLDRVIAEHALEGRPSRFAGHGRVLQPQELGFQPLAGKLQRPRLFAAEPADAQRGQPAAVEDDGIQRADGIQPRIALADVRPLRRVDRAGDDDQPAGLVGHPLFEVLDLQQVQQSPIGIESHDAIVLKQILRGFRKLEQQLVRFLRDALHPRLQPDVRGDVLVAIQHVPQELVLAGRTARDQQHACFAIHDFDVRCLEVVARIAVGRGVLDRQLIRAAADFVRRDLELDGHNLAFAAQFHAVLLLDGLRLFAVRHAGRRRAETDFDRAAGHAVGLHVAGQRKPVAGVDPFRRFQIHNADVGGTAIAAQSHRVDGDLGQPRQCRCGRVLDAFVSPAVSEHDQPGNRTPAFFVDQVADGVSQSGLQAAGSQLLLPVNALRLARWVRRGTRVGGSVRP